MTPREVHEKAVKRIRAAQTTGQDWLNLGDLSLESVPDEIRKLSKLRILSLGLFRYVPQKTEFKFDLKHVGLPRPLSDLSSLAGLTGLQMLDLGGCKALQDVSVLAKLMGLQTLDLCGCEALQDVSELSGLTGLQTLDLNWCEALQDVSVLAKLRGLQTLGLSCCKALRDVTVLSGLTGLQELDLRGYKALRDVTVLSGLTGLQTLDLSYCSDLQDVSGLSGLTGLQTLELRGCEALQDVSGLSGLTGLQTLDLRGCKALQDVSGLLHLKQMRTLNYWDAGRAVLPAELLDTFSNLESLITNSLAGAPPEVLSEDWMTDCLTSVRAWWSDLKAGEAKDQEIKVFVLGNGGVGKTQICRRLQGEKYDPSVPTTHGVQLGHFQVLPPTPDAGGVRASLWDFGGQDLYHGTHALFLEGRAVFIIVWHPEREQAGEYEENGIPMRHQPLTYWLDYVRSLAGPDAPVLVVQAQCDQGSQRREPPLPVQPGFTWLDKVNASAKEPYGMELLEVMLRGAARALLERHGAYRLPASWLKVRKALRAKKKQTLSKADFEKLCRKTHGTSVPSVLLDYLHRSGVIFYHEGLFHDQIVLDQEWALRAIYAVFDRKGAYPVLQQLGGIFSPELLDRLVWGRDFSREEQKVFLSLMQSCSICFPLHSYGDKFENYVAIDLLPDEATVASRIKALWPENENVESVVLAYDFLHEGILRQFLCSLGRQAGPDALYWRYGCCFYDANTNTRARVLSEYDGIPAQPARGRIRIETQGGGSAELLKTLRHIIIDIRIGPKPSIESETGTSSPVVESPERETGKSEGLAAIKVAPMPPNPGTKPVVYISYAWGGEKEALVDRLCVRLEQSGYDVRRDKGSMRSGDWISEFMLEIGRGMRVIAVISEKYLRSAYCMRELLYVYQSSLGEKEAFLQRVTPLILEDATVGETLGRLAYVRHWAGELQKLKDATSGIEPSMWGGAGVDMALIQDFCHRTEYMLRFLSDKLVPRGIKDIEKDNFAAVLEALERSGKETA